MLILFLYIRAWAKNHMGKMGKMIDVGHPFTFKSLKAPSALIIVIYVAIFSYFLYKSIDYPLHDFSNAYFGSYLFLKGQFDLGIFDPSTFNLRIFQEGFSGIFASYNPNPPSASLFFIPFALLPPIWAKLAFNLFSIGLFLFSLLRLSRFCEIDKRYLLVIPIVFFVPIGNNIRFGQSYLLLFSLLAEGYVAHEKKQHLMSSTFWSIAIFIKVFPAIVFLFLLVKKDWKALVYLSTTCIVMLGLSISIQGWEVWKFYLLEVLPQNSQGKISIAYVANYQSFYMLFKYLFVKDTLLNPQAMFDHPFLFDLFLALVKILILVLCTSFIHKQRNLLAFGFMLLGAMLLMPYGSSYGHLLLVFLFIACLSKCNTKQVFILIGLMFVISNLNIRYFDALPLPLQFPRLFLTTTLFLYLYLVSDIRLDWLWLCCLPLCLLPLVFQSKAKSSTETLLLNSEQHPLMLDYGVKDGFLFYEYWDEKGKHNYPTTITGHFASTPEVRLIDNQLYYQGKQLTSSSDHKLKPLFLNDKIVYLSDKGRGMGFYALWFVPIKQAN